MLYDLFPLAEIEANMEDKEGLSHPLFLSAYISKS